MSSLADLLGFFFAGKIWCSQVADAEKKTRDKISHPKTSFGNWPSFQFFAGLKRSPKTGPVWIFMVMSYWNAVSLGNLRLDAIQMKWLSSWWPLNIPAPKVHEKLSFSVIPLTFVGATSFLWFLTGTITGSYIEKIIYVKASESDSELKLSTYDFWEVPEGLECFH